MNSDYSEAIEKLKAKVGQNMSRIAQIDLEIQDHGQRKKSLMQEQLGLDVAINELEPKLFVDNFTELKE